MFSEPKTSAARTRNSSGGFSINSLPSPGLAPLSMMAFPFESIASREHDRGERAGDHEAPDSIEARGHRARPDRPGRRTTTARSLSSGREARRRSRLQHPIGQRRRPRSRARRARNPNPTGPRPAGLKRGAARRGAGAGAGAEQRAEAKQSWVILLLPAQVPPPAPSGFPARARRVGLTPLPPRKTTRRPAWRPTRGRAGR